jgi:hypothetical protein
VLLKVCVGFFLIPLKFQLHVAILRDSRIAFKHP